MRTHFSIILSTLFAVALFVGVFQSIGLPAQGVFGIPVAYAQADGGMGGGACDATGGDMGGGACDTGGGTDTGGGGGDSNDGTDTPGQSPRLPGTQLTILGVGCNISGPFVTVSVSPGGGATEFKVDVVTSLNDPEGSVVGSKSGIPGEGGTYDISFPKISGVHYHGVQFAYRDGVWVYANVSDHFLAPDCAPETPACPAGQTGTYPNCVTPSCPAGQTGTYPNCVTPTCAAGQVGTYPNCITPTWITYCTMGNDPNGNNWQWWQYTDDTTPRSYQPLRAGDGVCVAPVTGNPPVTATCDANGRGVTLSWPAVVGASAYSPRVQGNQTSCMSGWTWWTGDGTGGCYQDNLTTTSTYLSGLTPNTTYMTWVHTTINGVRDNQLNNSTFSCPVVAQADLTVSGITPTSAIAGTATTFSATVTNTGSGSTGIGFKNFYQVRSGSVVYEPHTIFAKLFNIAHAAETITDLAYTTMSALTAGGSGVATQTYTFPTAGTYGIRVCADKADRNDAVGLIPESNEDNNCGGWTDVNVTAACTPGASCSASNACNYQSGTYTSSCTCSASVPPVPSNFGNSCTSAANVCGQTNSGTILCNGTCGAVTPSDTQCLPTVTLSANPTRVRKDTSTKLTWTSVAATSCSLTGQNGFSSTALSGTSVDSTPLDAQTTFTLVCTNAYGSKSASVIVNLLPSYIEQ